MQKRAYIIYYELTMTNGRVIIFKSQPIKALFKWTAILKFKRTVHHNKSFKRKIVGARLAIPRGRARGEK